MNYISLKNIILILFRNKRPTRSSLSSDQHLSMVITANPNLDNIIFKLRFTASSMTPHGAFWVPLDGNLTDLDKIRAFLVEAPGQVTRPLLLMWNPRQSNICAFHYRQRCDKLLFIQMKFLFYPFLWMRPESVQRSNATCAT